MSYDYEVVDVIRVVDGDTFDLRIDLGFHLTAALRFRLMGVDTPELYGRYATSQGPEAKTFVEQWTTNHNGALRVRTYKGDSFGRWLADLYDSTTEEDLAEALIDVGLGKVMT